MNQRKTYVQTPLPPDALWLHRMEGREALGEPFELQLDLHAKAPLTPTALLGEKIAVHHALAGGKVRYFHGYVTELHALGGHGRHLHYRAVVRPWLWFLTRSAGCRIFQRKSVPEIVKQVCADRGFTDVAQRLSGSYAPCAYRVQYRETDFDFISRLLEQEGIYYYFEHTQTKHTLVLADGPAAHDPVPGYETVKYAQHGSDAGAQADKIDSFQTAQRVQAASYVLDDYDFEKPGSRLEARLHAPKLPVTSKCEVFDYPGGYVDTAVGERYARVRLEALHARCETATASGGVRGLGPGAKFTLAECPRAELNRAYLVVEARYRFALEGRDAAPAASGPEAFRCELGVIASDTPFRPARTTRRPVIAGVQTATVVGPRAKEIWTDEYGRVKVQFHWDREGKSDENSSCWLRVAQTWAGSGWGTLHVPRVGHEVIVSFLEGDPDHPIVIGGLYNGRAAPPFRLPDSAMISGVKTDSTPQAVGYNELSFDDTKSREKISVHAQRDLLSKVENDCTLEVGNELSQSAKRDVTIEAGRTLVLKAGDELKIVVGLAQIVLNKTGVITITGLNAKLDALGNLSLRIPVVTKL